MQSIAHGPVDVSSWKKIGGQSGSNPGGVFRSPEGDKWYIKTPSFKGVPQPDIAKNEALGNALYKLAGVRVPEMQLVTLNGNLSVASKIAPGIELGKLNSADRAAAIDKAKPGFAADAWLGGYDVAGYSDDNMLYDKSTGNLTRIDQGGTLNRRAQGKPREFNSDVTYFDSLRDPDHPSHQSDMDVHLAGQTAGVFGDMSPAQLKSSAQSVISIPRDKIEFVVKQFGGDAKLVDTLVARQQDIAQRVKSNGGVVIKSNPYHEPAGSSTGGQFTTSPSGGGMQDFKAVAAEMNANAASTAGLAAVAGAVQSIAKPNVQYLHLPANSLEGSWVGQIYNLEENDHEIKGKLNGFTKTFSKDEYMVVTSSTPEDGKLYVYKKKQPSKTMVNSLSGESGKGDRIDHIMPPAGWKSTEPGEMYFGKPVGGGPTNYYDKKLFVAFPHADGTLSIYEKKMPTEDTHGGPNAHQAAIASVAVKPEWPDVYDTPHGEYMEQTASVKETPTHYVAVSSAGIESDTQYPKTEYMVAQYGVGGDPIIFKKPSPPPKPIEAPLKAATPEQTLDLYKQFGPIAHESSAVIASSDLALKPAMVTNNGNTVTWMSDSSHPPHADEQINYKNNGIIDANGMYHSNYEWGKAAGAWEASMKKGDYIELDDNSNDAYDYVKENGTDNLKPALSNGYAVYTGDEGESASSGAMHQKVNEAGFTAAEHAKMANGWVDSNDHFYTQASIHDAQVQVESDQQGEEDQNSEDEDQNYPSVATMTGKGLSSAERNALSDYTGSDYGPINQIIKNPTYAEKNGYDLKQYQNKINAIRSVFARSTLDNDETFTRGTGGYKDTSESKASGWGKLIENAKKNGADSLVGQMILKPQFQSFSKKESASESFGSGVYLTVHVPEGTPAIDINDHSLGITDEQEVLLPYGSYKVTKAKMGGYNGKTLQIEADFIPSKQGVTLDPPKTVNTDQGKLPLNEPEQPENGWHPQYVTSAPRERSRPIPKFPSDQLTKSAFEVAKASVGKKKLPDRFAEDWSDWDHPIMPHDIYSIAALK